MNVGTITQPRDILKQMRSLLIKLLKKKKHDYKDKFTIGKRWYTCIP